MLTIKKSEILSHQLNECNPRVKIYKSAYEILITVVASDDQNGHNPCIFITSELELELLSGNNHPSTIYLL